jgi:hypothetical protein
MATSAIRKPIEYSYDKLLTLEQMKKNMTKLEDLAQQDSFTDDDYYDLSDIVAASRYLPAKNCGFSWANVVKTGFSFKTQMKQQDIYEEAICKVYDKIDSLDQSKYCNWISYTFQHPKPENFQSTKIRVFENQRTVTCSVCHYTDFASSDSDGIFGGGGMEAYFVDRIDSEYTPGTDTTCHFSICEKTGKRFRWGCCRHRDVHHDIGPNGRATSTRCIATRVEHCTKHCDCFNEAIRGKKRMIREVPRMVTGGYGSCIDCGYLQYHGPDEFFKPGKNICDWCINKMLYEGNLEFVYTYDE